MDLTFASLADRVGGTFTFTTTTDPLDLELIRADANEHGGGSLVFTGPPVPQLAQGTYEISGPSDLAGPLFVVPVAADDDSTTYQAVFG